MLFNPDLENVNPFGSNFIFVVSLVTTEIQLMSLEIDVLYRTLIQKTLKDLGSF